MNKPVRIKRKRTKGFKLVSPNGLPIVYVGRPSKWGNPYKLGSIAEDGIYTHGETKITDVDDVLRYYEVYILNQKDKGFVNFKELKGKNLACWCKLSEPCHADILLQIANS